MKFKNYDKTDKKTNFKQNHKFMPDRCFRMFIVGPSGFGKANALVDILPNCLVYFDKVYLYIKNLEEEEYESLMGIFEPINKEAGYKIIETSNDKIIPVSDMSSDNQKMVIFDDFICEKKIKIH